MGALEGEAHDPHLWNTEVAMAAPYAATMGSDAGCTRTSQPWLLAFWAPALGTKKRRSKDRRHFRASAEARDLVVLVARPGRADAAAAFLFRMPVVL